LQRYQLKQQRKVRMDETGKGRKQKKKVIWTKEIKFWYIW
jgi:hypothetical protein